jgi:hypothetical protein
MQFTTSAATCSSTWSLRRLPSVLYAAYRFLYWSSERRYGRFVVLFAFGGGVGWSLHYI